MMKQEDDDNDDGIADIDFPEVINFKSFENEVIYRSSCVHRFIPNAELKAARDWLTFRDYSQVLDAWARWNNSEAITEEEVCSFLNVSVSCPSLKLVKSYLLGEHVAISVEKLKDVLEISDMLFLSDIANYCKYRIQNIKLNEDNFLQILEVSSLYDFVHPHMKYFVISHLPLLTDMEGSEGLTYDTVVFLLTEDVLAYWTMEHRFNFVAKWCKACISRVELFTELFELIDISCLEQEFIHSVVKTDKLVRGTNQGMRRVDDALQLCRNSKPSPSVVIGDTYSNELFVFNFKNRRSGNISVPINTAIVSIVTWTVLLPDDIMLITCDRRTNVRLILKYNMHTRKTESKYLYSYEGDSHASMDNIAQFLWQNDMAFFTVIHEVTSLRRPKVRSSMLPVTPCCTVYMKDEEYPETVVCLPLLSFKFEIMEICVIGSSLLLRPHSETHIYCFNWTKYALTKTTIPQNMHSSSPSSLLALLPLDDALYAVFHSYIIQCTFNESTAEITFVRKFYVDVGSDPFVTIATTEGALFRVDQEYIHVCDSIQDSSPWKPYELSDRDNISPNSIVNYVFLKKNIDLCHPDCPHCGIRSDLPETGYIDLGEPYQINASAKRERENAIFTRWFGSGFFSGYDNYDEDSDYYHDDYDDDYDDDCYDEGPRMIFLASDDEWVEEWW